MGHQRWILPAYAVAAASAGIWLGSWTPGRWLWPLVVTIFIYPLFVAGVRRGRIGTTVGWMVLWALAATLALWGVEALRGSTVGERIFRGPAYSAEMLHWIRTGEGAEGSPALFLPVHARHIAIFTLVSLVSGGFAGLYMGVILLNYMNHYVAELAAIAIHPGRAYAFGWPPWAVLRVVGYIAVGTALAHLFYGRILRRGDWNPAGFKRWLAIGFGLVMADAILKALCAGAWRQLLRGTL